MAAGLVLGIISIVGLLVIAFFLWKLDSAFEEEVRRLERKIASMDIESKLASSFSDSSTRGIDNLSKIIATRVRDHFGVKAKSQSDLIEQIKKSGKIEPELKSILEEFFTELTHIAYRQDGLDEGTQEELQEKARIILKKLH